ncbi:hypothetical protein RUM44_013036 [Polyplax serrata]|uniref:Large ribosomal subunit protein bL19m n=1 Tax=Polyplax serrata TaxID=468196 RepID=A0ABR1BGT2_POLSC
MLTESLRFARFLKHFLNTSPRVNKFFCSSAGSAFEDNQENLATSDFEKFRFKYQDFLPSPNVKFRNALREKLERRDMLRRRNIISIPEFYVGSIMAVTSSNQHASGKSTRFVGICIMKYAQGLNSKFILRNIVEQQGVEILYNVYSPLIQKIEVLKLEKRLDEELFYLRDAPNEYSTVPFDMQPEYRDEKSPVPLNTIKVKINPRPWFQKYEIMNLKGIELPPLPEKLYKRAKQLATPWVEYDLMDMYRRTIPEEEQQDIFNEICDELKQLEAKQKIEKKKKATVKTKKSYSIF